MNCKLPVSALALLIAGTMLGCGTPAAPEPPSLNLPIPVMNLSAIRIGDSVHLAWTMPTRTTDRLLLRHPIPAQICRALEGDPCTSIAQVTVAAGKAGEYMDPLPSDLTQGSDRLLSYKVTVTNHGGKSAGPSNIVYSAAGPSPLTVTGLTWQVRQDGVLLSWQPAATPGKSVVFRIERLQLTSAGADDARRAPLAPAPPPAAQTLAVHGRGGEDPGHAIDSSVLFNQRYRYGLERVVRLELSGHSVEVQGPPGNAVEVPTEDKFPPAVPQGLVAVADTAAGAIDLSWSPDSDNDLAAYHVYRRDLQAGSPAQRVASTGVQTSFRDSGALTGHTYAYSVSAIDQSGNESQPSREVEETLPKT